VPRVLLGVALVGATIVGVLVCLRYLASVVGPQRPPELAGA
jgi:hypothetical protein